MPGIQRLLLAVVMCAVIAAGRSSGAAGIAPAQTPGTGGYSPSFHITGAVQRQMTFDLTALVHRPSKLVAHRCYSTDTLKIEDRVYRGIPLWTLLTEAGLSPSPGPSFPSLRGYVVVTGSDGYEVLLPLADIDPEFEGREVIVAYAADGDFLDETRGMARLVIASDRTCMRGVWWLATIEVRYID
jgi:DMSO/TMAO reductase YedYZ molybdopterin-dependent catalytic subunit